MKLSLDKKYISIIPILLFVFLSLFMIGCKGPPLEITTESLPDGHVGVEYYAKLNSAGGGDRFFLSSGSLPPGIQLSESGVLDGIPTVAGTFNFTIGLVDYGNEFSEEEYAYKGFNITIH